MKRKRPGPIKNVGFIYVYLSPRQAFAYFGFLNIFFLLNTFIFVCRIVFFFLFCFIQTSRTGHAVSEDKDICGNLGIVGENRKDTFFHIRIYPINFHGYTNLTNMTSPDTYTCNFIVY